MSKPVVFISCGQYTNAEIALGEEIARIVKATKGVDAFFAQQQSDLNGLHDNILRAIKNCVGFIAVMHPRGTVDRPNQPPVTRASVWIEQEIGIAAYIQFTEKNALPVVAFIHESINLEGIRTLLQLNPTRFTHDEEVLAALPQLLKTWKLEAGDLRVELESSHTRGWEGHQQFRLEVFLVNNTSRRIVEYDTWFKIPTRLLGHSSPYYPYEVTSPDPSWRAFRFNQLNTGGMISPQSGRSPLTNIEYCLTCGQNDASDSTGSVDSVYDDIIEAKVWIEGQEYSIKKTLGELHDRFGYMREVYSAIAPRK